MVIPSSRIRLLDTIGHGNIAIEIFINLSAMSGNYKTICVKDSYKFGILRIVTSIHCLPLTKDHHMIIFSSGEFGIVYKAHLLPQVKLDSKLSSCPLPQTVAVKTLKGKSHHFSIAC